MILRKIFSNGKYVYVCYVRALSSADIITKMYIIIEKNNQKGSTDNLKSILGPFHTQTETFR